MRKPPLLAALGLAAALAAAPLVRGESAYSSLVGLAASPDDAHAEEGRLPEGLDRPLARAAAAPAPAPRSVAPAAERPVTSAAAPLRETAELRDAVRDEDPRAVSGTSSQRTPAWVKVVGFLLPSTRPGIPELKASTSPFAGARPVRRSPPYVPHETEEGVRRGMAEMMAIMSAGAEPPAPSAR
jgi:hypothetical protein